MNVEAVAAGQAVALVGETRRHGRLDTPIGATQWRRRLAIGAVAVRHRARTRLGGALVVHGYYQFIASGNLQRIRRVAAIADGAGSALAVPLAAHELVALAGKEYAELVAEVVFEID